MPDNAATVYSYVPDRVSCAHEIHPARASLERAWITYIVVLLSVLAYAFPAAAHMLQLSKESTPVMLLMTSITCHLTHWSFEQLFWDVAAFWVLGVLCEQTGQRRFLLLLLCSTFLVSLSVCCWHPEIATYRGLSGVDSALFVYLACQFARDGHRADDWRRWAGIIAWLAFTVKVVFEMVTQDTLIVDAGAVFEPLPMSHAAGALAGTLVFCMTLSRSS